MPRLNPFPRPKTKRMPRRRSASSRRSGWPRLIAWGSGGAAAAALLVGGPWYLWSSGWIEHAAERVETAFFEQTVAHGLFVREALVRGRVETDPGELRAALGVAWGDPILATDLAAAKARLEALAWVERAAVSRRLPGTLAIHLFERRPAARWQSDARLHLIDRTGAILERDIAARHADLPVIAGDGALDLTETLLQAIWRHPTLARRLTAAVRIAGRRWNLRFDDAVEVRLPAESFDAALARLAELESREKILSRDMAAIDLRLPDRITVKPRNLRPSGTPGPDTRRGASGQDT